MSDKTVAKEEGKKTCFVIMPISDCEGYESGHFTRVYEHIIKPACEKAGFEPIRADETSKANVIIVDILQQIYNCDIAICDLSSRNANVFYELGFRQAFNKKTVLIKDTKTAMPFDISGIRTLTYNENLRVDEVAKIVPEISKSLIETEKAEPDEVNSLLKLMTIKKAELPKDFNMSTDLGFVLNEIRALKSEIANKTLLLDMSGIDSKSKSNEKSNQILYTIYHDRNKDKFTRMKDSHYDLILDKTDE